MSKKKKNQIEEPLKKAKAAPKAGKKKNIIPASLPVLVRTAAPEGSAPPPAEPAPLTPAAPAAKTKKAPFRKPAAKKQPAPKKTAARKEPVIEEVVVEEIVLSTDDIALRAYFIAEARRNRGEWGDETGDWVEAERQLRAEAAAGRKK